jgi:pimeloyl-ACP methyl ester carboxylesterase
MSQTSRAQRDDETSSPTHEIRRGPAGDARSRRYRTPGAEGHGKPITHRVPASDGILIRALEWAGADLPAFQILHGAMGNASMWQYLADAFPERRIVASDHRGYGETEGPVGTCNTDWHIRDAETVRTGLELSKPILIGYSGGAVDSVHYVGSRSDVVSALVLIDPPMFAPPPKEVMDFFATVPREYPDLDAYVDVQRNGPLMRGANPRLVRLYGTYVLRPGSDGVWRPHAVPQALGEWNPSLARLDVWSLAARIRVPTLVIRAGGAPILPAAVAEKLVSTLADGRLAVVEGASHALPFDDPDALHSAIRDFVSEISR